MSSNGREFSTYIAGALSSVLTIFFLGMFSIAFIFTPFSSLVQQLITVVVCLFIAGVLAPGLAAYLCARSAAGSDLAWFLGSVAPFAVSACYVLLRSFSDKHLWSLAGGISLGAILVTVQSAASLIYFRLGKRHAANMEPMSMRRIVTFIILALLIFPLIYLTSIILLGIVWKFF